MKKPFFSIVIPTYNRPGYLKMAIKSVLRQNFNDFEIVVNDNSQNLLSRQVSNSFKDKRICYFKNKANLGYFRNLYQVIKKASGKYVFILGDDDLILKKKTLFNIHKLIEKYNYGYIRLKYVYYKNFNYLFSHFNADNKKNRTIEKDQSNVDVYQFIYDAVFQFISGNVFKNVDISIPELATGYKKVSMEDFYIKFLFEACKSDGGCIDDEDIILAKWSTTIGGTYAFDVIDNRIFLEKSWDLFFPNLSEKEKQRWIIKQTNDLVFFLPSLKYYTSSINVIRHMKRTFELNKNLIYNPKYYFSAFMALIIPRFMWDILRNMFQSKKRISIARWKDELDDLKKFVN